MKSIAANYDGAQDRVIGGPYARAARNGASACDILVAAMIEEIAARIFGDLIAANGKRVVGTAGSGTSPMPAGLYRTIAQ